MEAKPLENSMTDSAAARQLRKDRDTLYTAGTGVIAFGVWTSIKMALSCVLFSMGKFLLPYLDDTTGTEELTAFYIGMAMICAVDLAFRLYVGLAARAESRRCSGRWLYIAVAVVMAAASLGFTCLGIYSLFFIYRDMDTLVSAVIELSSCSILLMIIVSGIRVRRYRKQGQKLFCS